MNAETSLPRSMDELLERMQAARERFKATIDGLTEQQLRGPRDAAGWSVKDHIAHVYAWERSMVYLLQSKPRHLGLGVDPRLYLMGDVDAINEEIHRHLSPMVVGKVRERFEQVHEELLATLGTLTFDELMQTHSDFLPEGETGGVYEEEFGTEESLDRDAEPVLRYLINNTEEHYDMHREWIEEIVGEGA